MIEEMIAGGESDTLEFKLTVPKDPMKFVKSALAFSNSMGGTIVFGVDDDRNVVGVDDPYRLMDQIVDTIIGMSEPQIFPESYVITLEGKDLVVIEIRPGMHRPYHLKNRPVENGTYVRNCASNRLADEDTLAELVLEGSHMSFDEQICADRRFDSDSETTKELIKRLETMENRKISSVDLVNMGLIKEEGTSMYQTNAFALLTDNPFQFSRIQCARFRGNDRSGDFIDRKEYTGSLFEQAERATQFVLEHINHGAKIDSLYREDRYEIPPEAIREVITNAIVHRSYVCRSTPVFVAVYDDFITVTSPGTTPFGLTIEKIMSGYSRPRNPLIAGFFKKIGLTEGWGSGIKRVFSSCAAYGLERPQIKVDDVSFDFTIFREGYVTGELIIGDLTENEKKVIRCMRADSSMNVNNISSKTGMSTATVNRVIRLLKDRNLLKRDGANKKGHWVLML